MCQKLVYFPKVGSKGAKSWLNFQKLVQNVSKVGSFSKSWHEMCQNQVNNSQCLKRSISGSKSMEIGPKKYTSQKEVPSLINYFDTDLTLFISIILLGPATTEFRS